MFIHVISYKYVFGNFKIVVPAAWDDVGWLQRRRESILPLGVPGLWHVSWDRNHAYHRHVRGQDENHDGTLKQQSTNPEKTQQCTNQLKVCVTDYCHDGWLTILKKPFTLLLLSLFLSFLHNESMCDTVSLMQWNPLAFLAVLPLQWYRLKCITVLHGSNQPPPPLPPEISNFLNIYIVQLYREYALLRPPRPGKLKYPPLLEKNCLICAWL